MFGGTQGLNRRLNDKEDIGNSECAWIATSGV